MKKGRKDESVTARRRPPARATNSSKRMVAAASMVMLPMVMHPHRAMSQGVAARSAVSPATPVAEKLAFNFIKLSTPYTALGVAGGQVIYKSAEGYFTIDKQGDMKAMSETREIKNARGALTFGRDQLKGASAQVNILGVDRAGNVIMKNLRTGERFYLNKTTGDMVIVSSR